MARLTVHPSLKPFVSALRDGTPQKVVMFGDSITFGSQVDPAFDHDIVFHRQWADQLRERWPAANLEVINRGVPGNKIADALARFESDVVAHSPHLVVVEFGINDCWSGPDGGDAYEAGLRQLVTQLKTGTTAPIILLTANMMNFGVTPQALQHAWFAEVSANAQKSGWMDDYMNRMRRVATQLDVCLADGYAKYQHARARGLDTDTLLANGANHPNEQGHGILADALLEVF
ncbi:MAG: SGNH/GDSL hydrolase family protein [Candidatus Sumerlaeaceae bacterium]